MLLLQVPHPSLVIFLVHLVPSSTQGLCVCCSIRNPAPRELWGLLSHFFLVCLINAHLHLQREVFPQLPVNKTAHRQSKFPSSPFYFALLLASIYLALFFFFIEYILRDGRICFLHKPFRTDGQEEVGMPTRITQWCQTQEITQTAMLKSFFVVTYK